MGAREVRVEVDHLRLDPQTELHAETTDGVHERRETLRPDHRVDSPVAEPRGVVPASEEPAVVQDEALDADSSGALGQRQERREVVVEVDRLPRVERDRARPRRVRGPCPQLGVEACGQVVETVTPRPEDPRRAVGRARGEVDLPRRQELAPLERRLCGDRPFGRQPVVAAPRHVHGVHPTALEAEPARPRGEQERGVCTRAPLAALPQVRADGEGSTLRCALAEVASGGVQDLGGLRRDGEGRGEGQHRVVVVAGVGEREALPDEAGPGDLELDHEPQPAVAVLGRDGGGRLVGVDPEELEGR